MCGVKLLVLSVGCLSITRSSDQPEFTVSWRVFSTLCSPRLRDFFLSNFLLMGQAQGKHYTAEWINQQDISNILSDVFLLMGQAQGNHHIAEWINQQDINDVSSDVFDLQSGEPKPVYIINLRKLSQTVETVLAIVQKLSAGCQTGKHVCNKVLHSSQF